MNLLRKLILRWRSRQAAIERARFDAIQAEIRRMDALDRIEAARAVEAGFAFAQAERPLVQERATKLRFFRHNVAGMTLTWGIN